ncbi:MAG: hypothetical protein ACKVZH_12545 [Blastocatellia bacterium]
MTSANIVGTAVTLLSSVLVGAIFSRKTEPGNDRARQLERELEAAKAELYLQHDNLGSLKSQVEKHAEQISSRDAKIAELESRLESADNEKFAAESGLNAANSRAEAAKSEIESLRSRLTASESVVESLRSQLAEAEAEVKTANERPPLPDPAMVAEIESLRKTVLSQNSDVAKLLERVKELAPLKLQITDRDLRLRQLETKFAETETAKTKAEVEAAELRAKKDDKVGKLKDRLAELENSATVQAEQVSALTEQNAHNEFMLGEKDSLIADLQAEINQAQSQAQSVGAGESSALRDKDAAISLLQLRVKELEPLTAQLVERDLKLRRLEEQLEESGQAVNSARLEREAEKAAEIVRLQARVQDLEAVRAEIAEPEAQSEHPADQGDWEEELARLQTRVSELEPLHAQLFARDARLIELEARLQSAINDKEAETKHFNALIAELEPAGERAEAAEARLKELEEQHRSAVNHLEVEISGLRIKLAGLEGAREMLEDCLVKLRAIEAQTENG